MIPVIMPDRKTQRDNYLQSLKNLKPYWRENGEVKSVNESWVLETEYKEVLNHTTSWDDIPEEPYIFWTTPTQSVPQETSNLDCVAQQALLTTIHQENPELYDATDFHPLEYAAFQVMYTRNHPEKSDVSEDVSPLDHYGQHPSFTRFIARGSRGHGPDAGVLYAFFFPGYALANFREDDLLARPDSGFRLLMRCAVIKILRLISEYFLFVECVDPGSSPG